MSDQYPQSPQSPQDPQQPPYGSQQGQYGQHGQQGADPTQAYGQQPPSYQPGYQQSYQPAPAPLSPEDERTWGALSHAGAVVAMILSAGFLGFVASIAVYVIYKDRGPFVRAHAANSINVQISMFIWLVIVTVVYIVLSVLTLGVGFFLFLPLFFIPLIVAGVLHVIGAIKAWQGQWWAPPLTPQIVK